MEISLNSKAEKIVEQKLASGEFASASEVVEKAVLLLDGRAAEQYAEFNTELQRRMDALDRGEAVDPDDVFARLRRRSAERRRTAA